MNQRVESQLMLEEVQRALKAKEFVPHYQPRVFKGTRRCLASKRCCAGGIPSAGWFRPPSSIPLLEEAGLIVPVGN